jgi:hypothetical protein
MLHAVRFLKRLRQKIENLCDCRYEDIAEASFGKSGRNFMTAVLYTELIGTCALFLILQKGVISIFLKLIF